MRDIINHSKKEKESEKNSIFATSNYSMKKFIFILTLLIAPFLGFGQTAKVGYVDTEYILGEIPEYSKAQEELDKLSQKYQLEVEGLYEDIKKKKDALNEEAILLPEDVRKKREEKIKSLETDAMKVQRQRFGVKGDLFQKRQELIKPIQESVFQAIQQVAEQQKYSFIFDKAHQSNLLYAKPNMDVSERVLKMIKVNSRK